MEYTIDYDKNLTITLHGRIDTVNSPVVEKELSEIIGKEEFTNLILDLGDVSFVSSAGLRIFLRVKQSNANLKITNVCQDVYEVFEMTGFTEIMDVQKAYRQFSIDGCEVIGKGACGTVYRVSDDTIVKVFKPDCDLEDIKRERDISHKAFILGIPTAISYDVVKVGDCYGTVYELLNCDTLKGMIAKDPTNLEKYAKMYSDLLHALHKSKVEPGTLPDMKAAAMERTAVVASNLPKEVGEKYVRLIESIPTEYTVLHGDCHIKNIMVQNGEPLFIDMDTLCYGNPIFDFARAYNAYFTYTEIFNQQNDHFIGLPYQMVKDLWKLTIMDYFDTKDPERYEVLMKKFAVVGCGYLFHHALTSTKFSARMSEESLKWLTDALIDAINSVDNLLL
ncbi:MAG: anti-sigma factor antagonist [Bacilli bacterium]|nr:anti-sigma factor antagonist [Bacilli bacterium]